MAAAFDIPLRSGIACLTACQAHLRDDNPFGGLAAYAESWLTAPFAVPYLVIPVGLALLARRFGHLALWMAAWLTAHAALHTWIVAHAEGSIYAVLMLGVILWTAWLWSRDAGLPAFRTMFRRWMLVIAPAAAAIAVTWTSASGLAERGPGNVAVLGVLGRAQMCVDRSKAQCCVVDTGVSA